MNGVEKLKSLLARVSGNPKDVERNLILVAIQDGNCIQYTLYASLEGTPPKARALIIVDDGYGGNEGILLDAWGDQRKYIRLSNETVCDLLKHAVFVEAPHCSEWGSLVKKDELIQRICTPPDF